MPDDPPRRDPPEERAEPPEGTRSEADESTSHEDEERPPEGQRDEDEPEPDYRELYRKARSEIRRLSKRNAEQREAPSPEQDQRIVAAERERDEAKEALRRERTDGRIRAEATRQGAVDPEVVARLVDPDEIDYDAAGLPTNVAVLVKDLLRDKPFLAGRKARPADAGDGTQGRSNARDMNDAIRAAAGSKRAPG